MLRRARGWAVLRRAALPAGRELVRRRDRGFQPTASCRTPHLRTCAPALGVRLGTDGTLSDEESARLADHQPEDPFGIEKFAWHTLYQACRAGISGGHAIVFH
ncbi:hypothetical protein GCM10010430_73930 [Kitasatospora cystarginea]|uniref:Uncharacterized protein n=1 Tax=Kitasatospora cystarginea TaxID=58350 RepID=A0ABN3EZ49_9ACTN